MDYLYRNHKPLASFALLVGKHRSVLRIFESDGMSPQAIKEFIGRAVAGLILETRNPVTVYEIHEEYAKERKISDLADATQQHGLA
jgi:hypothetical protein